MGLGPGNECFWARIVEEEDMLNRSRPILSLLIVLCLCHLACGVDSLPGDMDTNGAVDFEDLQLLAQNWLDAGCADISCGDLDRLGGVYLADNAGTMATIYTPGGNPEYPDWIELHNSIPRAAQLPGGAAISVALYPHFSSSDCYQQVFVSPCPTRRTEFFGGTGTGLSKSVTPR